MMSTMAVMCGPCSCCDWRPRHTRRARQCERRAERLTERVPLRLALCSRDNAFRRFAMNRRQFLASSAIGVLAAPALLRPAAATTNGLPGEILPRSGSPALARRDALCSDGVTMWFNCQGNGKLGRLDPRDGSYKLIDLGRLRAARRDRRAGQGRLGHRRRTECHRPRRQRPQGHGLQAAFQGLRQSQHRRFRQDRHLLVHRPERLSRPARSEVRRHAGVEVAGRPRQLRHDRHAERRHLVRLACGKSHRQGRPEDR